MRFLRTAPTRRLLAVTVGVVVAIASCTAIALAATSGGPVPPPKPLAQAIHDALSDGPVAGITAQVTFTNNLISSSDVEQTDPLLTGADGRLWLTKDHLRLELQSDNGDAQVVVDDRSFWAYDPTSNTVYKGTLPAGSAGDSSEPAGTDEAIPTVARIESVLAKLAAHVDGLTATPADVAGQPAYSVRVSPAQSGGMLGSIELAWDAVHGVPLSLAVYAKGDATAVLSLKATSIAYGSVALSDVDIAPPSGATVVDLGDLGAAQAGQGGSALNPTAPQSASGGIASAAALAAKGFSDPPAAGSLRLTSSRAVGADSASLTYGSGLGAVVVLERLARPGDSGSSAGTGAGEPGSGDAGDGAGLSLPTETIDGTSVTELSTELGTLLEFDRGGVRYIVAGSVPLSTANAVAAAL